jgi:hypothetical protein
MSIRSVRRWLRGCGFASTALAAACVLAAACSSSPKGSGGGTAGGGAGASGGLDGGAGSSGVASQTVTAQGGTVTLDGVTLTIPGNALSGDTVVTVSMTTAPAGYIIASAAYLLAPADATFVQAVSVTIPLTMPAPHAHLFLSDGSGGAAGAAGTAGSGAAGAGTAGSGAAGAGTAGASAGTAGSGAAGAGTAGASAGTAGSGAVDAGTAGSGGQPDAGQNVDASTDETVDVAPDTGASQLCAATGLNAPVVTVTNITDGTPVPAGSTYTGGTIVSGTYYLTAVTHYGGQYGGPQKAVRRFDATAQTLRTIESPYLQGTVLYNAYGLSNADDHTLSAALVCSSTQAASTSWYYTVSGTTITMSQVGSADVAVYSTSL